MKLYYKCGYCGDKDTLTCPFCSGWVDKPMEDLTDFKRMEFPAMEAEQAARYNEGKPKLSYLLSAANANKWLARVFEFGAKKYSRDNWLKGLPKEEVIDSLLRHLQAYERGELTDPESELPHVAHIHWNAMALAEFELRGDYGKSTE